MIFTAVEQIMILRNSAFDILYNCNFNIFGMKNSMGAAGTFDRFSVLLYKTMTNL